jgi:hypothetical protein
MQIHENSTMTPPRRGRPPVAARKEVVQVTLPPDKAEMLAQAAAAMDTSMASLGAKLMLGDVAWAEIERAAKKVRK